jgi:uncharacterized linocin/CFP29 family protein
MKANTDRGGWDYTQDDWKQIDPWTQIDKAVHDMGCDTRVARKFLPIIPDTTQSKSVPSDIIEPLADSASRKSLNFLTINPGPTITIFRISVGFSLTNSQLNEKDLSTVLTLAARASNLLSQAEDLLIFQGEKALEEKLFKSGTVLLSESPPETGLLNVSSNPVVNVPLLLGSSDKYGENTFAAVAKAYSILQGNGYYRDDVLVLPTDVYADTWAPLPSTLQTPADRIMNGLAKKGFYSTGTLPSSPPKGILVSPGEDTMDLVVALDATPEFLGTDPTNSESNNFQVTERLALRIKVKEPSAIVRLEFAQAKQ